jgi:hypothetical protein
LSADTLEISYADVEVSFDAAASTFSIVDHAGTSLRSMIVSPGDQVLDRANIPLADFFNLELIANLTDGGGLDDLSLSGTISGSGLNLSETAYQASLSNTPFSGDADGITFFAGILRLQLSLTGVEGASILVDPAGGDWIFEGLDDAPLGPAKDGAANQISIPSASRGFYTTGRGLFVDIAIPNFGDGSSTAGSNNADDFFAQAAQRGGFTSHAGDLQLMIVPEPASLAVLALGAVAALRRRPG